MQLLVVAPNLHRHFMLLSVLWYLMLPVWQQKGPLACKEIPLKIWALLLGVPSPSWRYRSSFQYFIHSFQRTLKQNLNTVYHRPSAGTWKTAWGPRHSMQLVSIRRHGVRPGWGVTVAVACCVDATARDPRHWQHVLPPGDSILNTTTDQVTSSFLRPLSHCKFLF